MGTRSAIWPCMLSLNSIVHKILFYRGVMGLMVLRALKSLNGPDHPHLGPPSPTPPGRGLYLSSALRPFGRCGGLWVWLSCGCCSSGPWAAGCSLSLAPDLPPDPRGTWTLVYLVPSLRFCYAELRTTKALPTWECLSREVLKCTVP